MMITIVRMVLMFATSLVDKICLLLLICVLLSLLLCITISSSTNSIIPIYFYRNSSLLLLLFYDYYIFITATILIICSLLSLALLPLLLTGCASITVGRCKDHRSTAESLFFLKQGLGVNRGGLGFT